MAYGAQVSSIRLTGDELALRAQDIYDNGNARMVMIQQSKKSSGPAPSVRASQTPALV